MIIRNDYLLEKFRRRLQCECCGKRGYVEAHHLWTRGMGGGGRLDININLIALCRFCHSEFHAGHVARGELLHIVARREHRTVDGITQEILRLRRVRQ